MTQLEPENVRLCIKLSTSLKNEITIFCVFLFSQSAITVQDGTPQRGTFQALTDLSPTKRFLDEWESTLDLAT
jgi:hypothetical protein